MRVSNMNALTIRGSYRGISGHDHHVREFVRQLHRKGVRINLLDIPYWHPLRLSDDQREPWFTSLNQPVRSNVALHFCMPSQVKRLRARLNVNFTMFEATRISKQWLKHSLRHDLIIVPTQSSYAAWVASGCPPQRIRICPLGVDSELFAPGAASWPFVDSRGRRVSEYALRVLNVSDLMPRKNLLGLLQLWIETTDRDDDAVLIIKLNCGSQKCLADFWHAVADLEAQIGRRRDEAASIVFMTNEMLSDAEMPSVYAAATHYLSLSYGEGWDQPMMEAASMGLQLIAPNHSAYTAYLDESIATLLPAHAAPAHFEWHDSLPELFRGAEWWEPDRQAAAASLRRILAAGKPAFNAAARARVVENFTWEKAAARLIDILEEIEALQKRRCGFRHTAITRLWPFNWPLQ